MQLLQCLDHGRSDGATRRAAGEWWWPARCGSKSESKPKEFLQAVQQAAAKPKEFLQAVAGGVAKPKEFLQAVQQAVAKPKEFLQAVN